MINDKQESMPSTAVESDKVASMPIPAIDPLLAMIERASRDPSIDLDRMERLIGMRDREIEAKAKEAFNNALADAQQELKPVAYDSHNPQTKSRYASYFAVDQVLRPVRSRHRFALTFDTEDGAPDGYIRVVAFLSKGRHTRRYHYDSPIVTTGIRGNEMMTLTHARASAVTYAKRYLVGMIFDLSIGEDKDGNDGGGFSGPVISEQQLTYLIELCDSRGADRQKFAVHLGVEELAKLPASNYATALAEMDKYYPARRPA